MNKTTTTLNPAPARPDASRQEQWEELRSVFPIYLALAKQLEIAIPFPQDKRNLPEKPPLELFKQIQNWLDGLDSRVLVHQLRHLLQQTTLNASESGLRALIQRPRRDRYRAARMVRAIGENDCVVARVPQLARHVEK